MPNKNKISNGPKTDEGKAISSRNSVTHGLTARHWLDVNEQSLYDETVKNLIVDFDPQTYIEKMLITKMVECSVRLMRIQNRESAMFDLASSEAGHPEESIKSLDNSSDKLIQAVCDAYSENWKLDPGSFVKKSIIIDEIDYQNLDDVTGWAYVEDNMPTATDYIIKKCTNENLNLFDFISRETDQSKKIGIRLISEGEDSSDEDMSLSIEEIVKGAQKISSYSLQKYLGKLTHSLAKDTQTQFILANLDQRSQQMKDAAIPDTQKLSLVQRYRTADERQFSKTLGELLELQKRRKESNYSS
jgi:hypothetical protein